MRHITEQFSYKKKLNRISTYLISTLLLFQWSCFVFEASGQAADQATDQATATNMQSTDATKQASLTDILTLKDQFRAELLDPPVVENEILTLLETFQDDRRWPDINYSDTSRTGFEHRIHLYNITKLAQAYGKTDSPFYQNSNVKQVIDAAFNFWLEHDFISENWWWNQIGTPERIGNILLLMDDEVSPAQKSGARPIVGRANLDASGARPGGDLIKIAGIMGKFGVFMTDLDIVNAAVSAIAGEIEFAVERGDTSDVRGIQTDYSFHHRHDRVTSTITYGLGFASYFIDWAEKVNGTAFRFPAKSIELITDYYLDGICKATAYCMYPDPGAENRGITRMHALNPIGPALPEKLLKLTSHRQLELEIIAQINNGIRNSGMENSKPLNSSNFFWNTEYFSHQRPHYFTSVRKFSSRNHSMEVPYNSEGLKNHHLADGYNFITRTGEEYTHIFPVWDWQKIPGTTIVQKPALPGPQEIQQQGLTEFVGGVSDGRYGCAAFDFESPLDQLTARKSWFFLDDEFVALGTAIESESSNPVITTLNQSLLKSDVIAAKNDGEFVLEQGEHYSEDILWVHHDKTAYLFPDPAEVHVENNQRSGSWYDITQQSWAKSSDEVIKDVFTLWLDHGASPKQAGYEYIVVPGIDAAEVAGYREKSPVRILANNRQIQAVQHTELGIVQIVFYEKGEIDLTRNITLSVNTSGLVMIRLDGDNVEKITVSDPSRKFSSFQLTLTSQLEVENDHWKAVWDEKVGQSRIDVTLPTGNYAGQSISLNVSE